MKKETRNLLFVLFIVFTLGSTSGFFGGRYSATEFVCTHNAPDTVWMHHPECNNDTAFSQWVHDHRTRILVKHMEEAMEALGIEE